MDQYSPAIITVPANMLSVEISQFPDNGTRIVANKEYTITVSAISDQETSYPSNPVVNSKLPCTYVNVIAQSQHYTYLPYAYSTLKYLTLVTA